MNNQRRSIPGRVILTALTLLAAASFTGLLAPPAAVACAPARPANDSQCQVQPDCSCR